MNEVEAIEAITREQIECADPLAPVRQEVHGLRELFKHFSDIYERLPSRRANEVARKIAAAYDNAGIAIGNDNRPLVQEIAAMIQAAIDAETEQLRKLLADSEAALKECDELAENPFGIES